MITLNIIADRLSAANFRTAVLAASGIMMCNSSAVASEGEAGASEQLGLEEIVVVSQRRTESLQDVPIAVSAFSGADVAAVGIENARDIGMVAPTLRFEDTSGWGKFTLRGVGTTALGPGIESPVAVYVDDVYYAAMTASAVELDNIQSIEVINGPQGTLFGRNATGGLVSIRTKDPSRDFGGHASVSYGNYRTTEASGYVTGAIGSRVAADLSLQYRNQGDGYGVSFGTGNQMGRNSHRTARTKWAIDATDNLKIALTGDAQNSDSSLAINNYPGSVPVGGPNLVNGAPVPPHDTNSPFDDFSHVEQRGLSAHIAYKLSFANLISISAWRKTTFDHRDTGTAPAGSGGEYAIDTMEPHTQYSQELQLQSLPGSTFAWTVGAYYFREKSAWTPAAPYGGPLSGFPSDQPGFVQVNISNLTKAGALFGQVTVPLPGARTNITAGIRVSNEKRDFTDGLYVPAFGGLVGYMSLNDPNATFGGVAFRGKLDTTRPTWRIAADHKFTDDVMGYLSYNRGIRSGGFTAPTVDEAGLKPETLDAVELGMKSEFANGRIRLNGALFTYKYKNMILNTYRGNFPGFLNGAAARIKGLDLTANARVTENLTINASGSFLNTRFTDFRNAPRSIPNPNPPFGNIQSVFDATGNDLPRAPDATTNLWGTYVLPFTSGNFNLTAAYSYSSGWFAEADNRLKQKAYGVLNAGVEWAANNGLSVKLWGKNLTDETYANWLLANANGDLVFYAPARTYGVSLMMKF